MRLFHLDLALIIPGLLLILCLSTDDVWFQEPWLHEVNCWQIDREMCQLSKEWTEMTSQDFFSDNRTGLLAGQQLAQSGNNQASVYKLPLCMDVKPNLPLMAHLLILQHIIGHSQDLENVVVTACVALGFKLNG